MSRNENIAYKPEEFGLEFLGEVDLEDEPWQFYIAGVWEGPEGFYISTDSGCSCPSPWENHTSLDDLTGPMSAEYAKEEIKSLWNASYYKGDLTVDDLNAFLKTF